MKKAGIFINYTKKKFWKSDKGAEVKAILVEVYVYKKTHFKVLENTNGLNTNATPLVLFSSRLFMAKSRYFGSSVKVKFLGIDPSFQIKIKHRVNTITWKKRFEEKFFDC